MTGESMTSHDPERSRSWSQYAWGPVYRTQLAMLFSNNHELLDSLMWGSTSVSYPSDSLASCSWHFVTSLTQKSALLVLVV